MFYDVPERNRVSPGNVLGWLGERRPEVQALLRQQGWVLIRGLPFATAAELAAARDCFDFTPYQPAEIFSPRQHFGERVYSAMRWPADRSLCPYSEQSFSRVFPTLILVLCAHPGESGGQTVVVDTRQVIEHLPIELAKRFEKYGWMMNRTFRPRFGMSWGDAFGITDPPALQARLAEESISYSWLPGEVLRTSRVLPAIVSHPLNGERCWFNQISFLSEWSLEDAERSTLVKAFGRDGLPVNTAFGDGAPLSRDEARSIEKAYDELSEEIAWRAGDLLLLDNVRVAHGRRPYTGNRLLRIAMAEPWVRDTAGRRDGGPGSRRLTRIPVAEGTGNPVIMV